jgi:hypothetical protein
MSFSVGELERGSRFYQGLVRQNVYAKWVDTICTKRTILANLGYYVALSIYALLPQADLPRYIYYLEFGKVHFAKTVD